MPELWIIACLFAIFANLGKVLLVKTHCRDIDSTTLMFAARLLPALLLLPVFTLDFTITAPLAFWSATTGAALITIVASWLYMEAVKHGELSVVTPIQATVPMFMMVCTALGFDETPPPAALAFIMLIILSVSAVMVVANKHNTPHSRRAVWYALLAAALFGISTVLDRVAVMSSSHGALVYSACWHWLTLLLLLLANRVGIFSSTWHIRPLLRRPALWSYVTMVLLAFLAQQYAVQHSLHLANGVTYVKTLIMSHIVLAAAIGILCFKERVSPVVWWANGLTLLSAAGLLWVA